MNGSFIGPVAGAALIAFAVPAQSDALVRKWTLRVGVDAKGRYEVETVDRRHLRFDVAMGRLVE